MIQIASGRHLQRWHQIIAKQYRISRNLRLLHSMRHYKKLDEPKVIATAGIEQAATTTGTIWRHIINQAGRPVPVCITTMVVPGPLLFHRSNVVEASTIFKAENLSVYFGSSASFPLNQHPEYMGLCSYDVSIRALRVTIDMSSTPAVDLDARSSAYTKEGDSTSEKPQTSASTLASSWSTPCRQRPNGGKYF